MSMFSDNEIEYLQSQRIGRLATVNLAGEPHVVPLRFHYNPELDMIELGVEVWAKARSSATL